MKNLYRLRRAKPTCNKISLKHDMTKQEREMDKRLQDEAKWTKT